MIMTEKEKLIREIDTIKREHIRKQSLQRKVLFIGGGTVLLLLALFLCLTAIGGPDEKKAGPYEDIAGTYRPIDVRTLDMFKVPEHCDGAGDCKISADGSIEFPYYDGEPDGEGEFLMTKGTIRRYQYVYHDYEVEIPGYEVHDIYLDTTWNGMVLHEERTYRGIGKSAYFREYEIEFVK